MTLRSKRLSRPLAPAASAFLDSTREDAALVRDDVLGSLAHVAGLARARILTSREAATLRGALRRLASSGRRFRLAREFEDVHMNVESWLTERTGPLGRKLHTGRSRNDQVALDLRLWARRAALDLAAEEERLAARLLATAHGHLQTVMPGHTHFQIAQPVSLAHTLGAHAARLARDLERALQAFDRANVSPLGAGALAGTSHRIEPSLAARLLGFDRPFANSLDAVSDRDFVHDLLYAAAVALNHASSLAEELILFTHPAFGFATIDDAHATGSSLMPQKKNPDVLEVARAKAATLLGALMASLVQTKALPLAYNRDLQEQKRVLLESLPEAVRTMHVLAEVVGGLTFHPDRMAAMAGAGYSDATELADYLVRRGAPFRDAHEASARCVQAALAQGVPLAALPLSELRKVDARIGPDVFRFLGPKATLRAKTSPGATAPPRAREALRAVKAQVRAHAAGLKNRRRRVAKAEAALLGHGPTR